MRSIDAIYQANRLVDEARSERDRYRWALESIVQHGEMPSWVRRSWEQAYAEVYELAHEALERR